MTLKDKLPDRLKCSPLLTMESDSDIETIAESIVNLSDSDGDFFKKTSSVRATPYPIKKQCWRSSPHGRVLQTLSISRTMALAAPALTVPDF